MKIKLTAEQLKQLEPLEGAVTNAHNLGLTGMLVAQVFPRAGYMTVGFVRHAQAAQLVKQATERTPQRAADEPGAAR